MILATCFVISPEMTCKTSQSSVCLSVRPSGVNMFKTLRLQDRRADVDETWHLYSTGLATQLLGRDVRREWLLTFPFPPIPIYSIPIPSHPHSQVFDLFSFPWDSHVGYSHSLPFPFPFRVSDRVMVSLGMWDNPKFTRPSIASIRIMSSVYMQISNRKVKFLPMPIAFRFVT